MTERFVDDDNGFQGCAPQALARVRRELPSGEATAWSRWIFHSRHPTPWKKTDIARSRFELWADRETLARLDIPTARLVCGGG
jgi:hypothetical protein